MTTKPTYEELRQALQSINTDAFNTYKALETHRPVVSIGQWMRVTRSQALIRRIDEAEQGL